MRYDRTRHMPASEVEARFCVAPERCPFCGSGDVGLFLGPLPHMSCLACGADGPLSEVGDRQYPRTLGEVQYQALMRWNARMAV